MGEMDSERSWTCALLAGWAWVAVCAVKLACEVLW